MDKNRKKYDTRINYIMDRDKEDKLFSSSVESLLNKDLDEEGTTSEESLCQNPKIEKGSNMEKRRFGFFGTSKDNDLLTIKNAIDTTSEADFEIPRVSNESTEKISKVLEYLSKLYESKHKDKKNYKKLYSEENNFQLLIDNCLELAATLSESIAISKENTDENNADRISLLEESNMKLKQEITSFHETLEAQKSEVQKLRKEKALMGEEIKRLTFGSVIPLEGSKCKKIISPAKLLFFNSCKEKETENDTYTKKKIEGEINENQTLKSFNVTTDASGERCSLETMHNTPNTCIDLPSNATSTESLNEKSQKNKEKLLDGMIRKVKERYGIVDSLNLQLHMYQNEILGIKDQIELTNFEKERLFKDLQNLGNDYKILLQEKEHYETILKLILREKVQNDSNVFELLDKLLNQMNRISCQLYYDNQVDANAIVSQCIYQALQDQNNSYREEINNLQRRLCPPTQNKGIEALDLPCNHDYARKLIEQAEKEAKEKQDEFTAASVIFEEKYNSLLNIQNDLENSRMELEEKLKEKENEIRHLENSSVNWKKSEEKYGKKIEQLNTKVGEMKKQSNDMKQNIKELLMRISEQKEQMKDQKTFWMERLNAAKDELSQNRENFKWLQNQIENLNSQVQETNNRLKISEDEKHSISQKLARFEKERNMYEHKLQELQATIQGDTLEKLMNKNDELQLKIDHCKKVSKKDVKVYSEFGNAGKEISPSNEGEKKVKNLSRPEVEVPPSDMSTQDEVSSIKTYHVSKMGQTCDALSPPKRNPKYTTTLKSIKEAPRNVVSLQNTSGYVSQNRNKCKSSNYCQILEDMKII